MSLYAIPTDDPADQPDLDPHRVGLSVFEEFPMPPRDGDWDLRAACKGMPTQMFYPEETRRPREPLAVCDGGCPVRRECLAERMGFPEVHDHGVGGGTTRDDRMLLRAAIEDGATLRQILDLTQPRTFARQLRERYGVGDTTQRQALAHALAHRHDTEGRAAA